MRTDARLLNEQYSSWLETRFQGKNVANIRFHLNHFHVEPCLRDDFYQKVADRFRHNYSRAFAKNVRKTGIFAEMIIHLHKRQDGFRVDAPHLHILAVYPDSKTIDDVSSFVFAFCNKRREDPASGLFHLDTMRTYEVADAKTITGSFIYNGREGHSSMLRLL